MSDLYRGDRIPLGSMADIRAAREREGRCRWFKWIGGQGCDACGGPASAHDGDLRSAADTPFGPDEWVGMPWRNSSYPLGREQDQVAFVEWLVGA